MDDLGTLLAGNPIFGQLDEGGRAVLAGRGIRRRYRKDEIIAFLGDVWPYFFMVEEGRVHAVKESVEGRRLIVTALEPGDILWGMAFFLPEAQMPVTLVAHEACRIILWDRDLLVPLLIEDGTSLWALSCMMVDRMRHASELVDNLAFHTVTGRVARMILDRFDQSAGSSILRDLTLEEMAAMVGTTREVVCRTLYRLAEGEIIQITRTEFYLTDKEALEALATGG
jgi:CRP-like cAMP-binding protein